MVNPNDCKKWPEGVPKTIDYPKVPLFHFLDESVEKYPNAPALVIETGSFDKLGKMNYRELGEASDKLAAFLVENLLFLAIFLRALTYIFFLSSGDFSASAIASSTSSA